MTQWKRKKTQRKLNANFVNPSVINPKQQMFMELRSSSTCSVFFRILTFSSCNFSLTSAPKIFKFLKEFIKPTRISLAFLFLIQHSYCFKHNYIGQCFYNSILRGQHVYLNAMNLNIFLKF